MRSKVSLPTLKWGKAKGRFVRLDEDFHSTEDGDARSRTGACQRFKAQRAATPIDSAPAHFHREVSA